MLTHNYCLSIYVSYNFYVITFLHFVLLKYFYVCEADIGSEAEGRLHNVGIYRWYAK